ncbi:MAG: hypothetical protein ABI169_17690 [Chitinophagaceae bacterium]
MLLLCVLAFSVFFAGCPLQTDEPILSDPDTQIPEWISGTWVVISPAKESKEIYRFERIATEPMNVMVTGLDGAGHVDKDNIRKAVLSYVGRQLFISVYDKGDEDNEGGYYHYAVAQNPKGNIFLVPVQEDLMPMNTTGAELASYFRNHAATSDYLDRENIVEFKKQEEEGKK